MINGVQRSSQIEERSRRTQSLGMDAIKRRVGDGATNAATKCIHQVRNVNDDVDDEGGE